MTKTPSQGQSETCSEYILVVDDMADNCFLLKAILEAEGYTVDVANNGKAALAKAEALPPALMLLDVMMPDMSGYEVTQHIRQSIKLADLPIVLITAHDQEIAMMGQAAGATSFIRKPFDFDELIRQVRTHAT
ncbi:MAG: response regulator [Stenomitos rutilans HA7619-LM2]|nr:response regulator [Stenomitos rutilans HA7619-LM2]